MMEFLLLFRNDSGDNSYIITPEDMIEDMPAWQSWIGNIASQGKLIASQPIEFQGKVVSKGGQTDGPFVDTQNQLITGFMLCKAESHEEALEWSKSCPILKYPSGSVEVRPLIPFPTNQ